MTAPTISVLLTLHALGLLALIIGAIINLRTYCESYGCLGLGLLWLFWIAAYAAILAIGRLAYRRSKASGGKAALQFYLVAAQLVLGLCLLGSWAVR